MNKITEINAKLSKISVFSNNSVKTIALISMIIDHFSKIVLFAWLGQSVFPLLESGDITHESYEKIDTLVRFTLPSIGAVAFPLFAFLLVEGFAHTRNRKKYFALMFLFAFISELPFDLAFFGEVSKMTGTFPFHWKYQNVFFTLSLGILVLQIIEKLQDIPSLSNKKFNLYISTIACGGIIALCAEFMKTDYGAMGVCYIVAFYILRENRLLQGLSVLVVYSLFTGDQPTVSQLLSITVILLYNNQHGKLNLKYLFYLFYPVHLWVFYGISQLFY
ncbi:MAG: TraX family protein [Eubacteriales bacterium]